ncbi:vgr related protein [Sphingorhabdus lutea]|uniref:Vgr related protein n=1 Tax=Sphingorhabdus lutea TaxID=1913578 RepID=A0A1L3JD63_9SPHN|nr:vgr related protein [Sphingorhabdus lutea]APG63081.1 vgr related protein [Sphingorhabdus lutea]
MFARQSGRLLTFQETALVRSVFGDAIDTDKVRVHQRKWWWFQPKKITMAPDGHLWFHPKGQLFCDDFCNQNLALQGHFIHEMTHVWQHQKGIFLPLKRHPFCRYDYSIKPGWTLERYGLEQQAEIVRHIFLLRKGYPVPGAPPLSHYDGILPF